MGLLRRRPRALDPQAAYALWSKSYPPWAHNELMRVEQRAMESILSGLAGKSIALDLGTGTGRYLRVLRELGASWVVGLDRSKEMLERAGAAGAPVVRADATALPLASGRFHLVLASLVAGDIEDLARWAGEVSRVLRPKGSFVYSDFHPCWADEGWERTFQSPDGRSWRLPYHPHSLDQHRAALESAGLELVETKEPFLAGRSLALVLHGRKP